VVARELPILLPPAGAEAAGPVAGTTGTVDLVLRSSTGGFTIVDYKTDRVESEDEIRARAEVYAPQLATYARAIGDSFGLGQPIATELWFLWPDRVWSVP